MAVTLKDVAERAGVSRSAVSRTFTDGASVSAKMREKVEVAARELGYHPNALASSLTTGRTKLIGLIANNFDNPVFMQVFDLFTRGLQERGLRPLLINLTEERDAESSVRMMMQYSVDGVIVASSTLPSGFAAAFQEAGIPVVHSFGRHDAQARVDVFGIDNVASGKQAAEVLIARGYTRIGFMGGPEHSTSTQDRARGVAEAVAAHPNVTATVSFAQNYSFDAGRREMLRLLHADPAEAYFCGDDILSVGALSAITDSGLSVPGDIGILGLNDMEMARWESVNLTTLRQPIADIVSTSIDRVVSMLDTPDQPPAPKVFDCTLIERGTLRPAP